MRGRGVSPVMAVDGLLMECDVAETVDTVVAKFVDRRYHAHLEEIMLRRLPIAVKTREGVRLMILSSLKVWRPTGAMTAHFQVVR